MIRRLEISRIVKNVIFRQQSFLGKAQQLAVRDHRRHIVKPTPVRILIWPNSAHDRGYSSRRRYNALKRIESMLDNIAILKPILRSVAMRYDLGKDN